MQELASGLKGIELKIKALIEANNKLQAAVQVKNDAIIATQNDNNDLKTALRFKDEELVALKTANAMLGSDDYKTKTRLKINALVKEIDQCINQLA
jgi:Flp pilus assembly protein TadG